MLHDIGRANFSGYEKPYATYLERFGMLMHSVQLQQDVGVVYVVDRSAKQFAEAIVQQTPSLQDKACFVHMELEDTPSGFCLHSQFSAFVQATSRSRNPEFASWLRNPEFAYPKYSETMWMKFDIASVVAKVNPFKSASMAYLDAGLHAVNLGELETMAVRSCGDRVCLGINACRQVQNEKSAFQDISHLVTAGNKVVVGTAWSGTPKALIQMISAMNKAMGYFLREQMGNDDQALLLRALLNDPDRFLAIDCGSWARCIKAVLDRDPQRHGGKCDLFVR